MRGFTLLEMLIAVFMIAVLSSVLALNVLPGSQERAEQEARRLAALLEQAAAEARASGKSIAWSPGAGGYVFWHRDAAGDWSVFPDSSVYRPRFVGEDVAVHGGRIVLSPYGLSPPFEATVSGGSGQFVLKGEVLGRVSLQRVHAR